MPPVFGECVDKGCAWLRSRQHADGGWGESGRDQSRIPHTAWVGILVPEVTTQRGLLWLEQKSAREASQEPSLTYKLALPLLALSKNAHSFRGESSVVGLLDALAASQEDDGGFAPWRGHPCGGDPWCTGVASLALLSFETAVEESVFDEALDWILSRQLANGLWPYHYIDEGSALAYRALAELLRWRKRKGL
ncbi:MAG: prenyltransferase/squalene oxidase repeat-containing protein [Smithella sp.]